MWYFASGTASGVWHLVWQVAYHGDVTFGVACDVTFSVACGVAFSMACAVSCGICYDKWHVM